MATIRTTTEKGSGFKPTERRFFKSGIVLNPGRVGVKWKPSKHAAKGTTNKTKSRK